MTKYEGCVPTCNFSKCPCILIKNVQELAHFLKEIEYICSSHLAYAVNIRIYIKSSNEASSITFYLLGLYVLSSTRNRLNYHYLFVIIFLLTYEVFYTMIFVSNPIFKRFFSAIYSETKFSSTTAPIVEYPNILTCSFVFPRAESRERHRFVSKPCSAMKKCLQSKRRLFHVAANRVRF